jgi:hypothetical protein
VGLLRTLEAETTPGLDTVTSLVTVSGGFAPISTGTNTSNCSPGATALLLISQVTDCPAIEQGKSTFPLLDEENLATGPPSSKPPPMTGVAPETVSDTVTPALAALPPTLVIRR